MSRFNPFANLKLDPSIFNTPISAAYLLPGRHTVSVSEIEYVNKYVKLILIDKNECKQTLLLFPDYNGTPSKRLINFINAILPQEEQELKIQFLQAVYGDHIVFSALKNSVVFDIQVEKGSKGYSIINKDDKKVVIDVATEAELFDGKSFDSFSDATDYVTAKNLANPETKLYRAYNEVTKFFKNEGSLEKNVQIIKKAINPPTNNELDLQL